MTLDVVDSRVIAMLVPNGAGKTAAIHILATLLGPDTGTVEIDGVNAIAEPHVARTPMGLSGQCAAVDDVSTGRESLTIIPRLARYARRDESSRVNELLERFDPSAVDKRVAAYSCGMRRRLDLA